MNVVRTALWKGCLGGIGMAVLFLAISGITYLVLANSALSINLVLLFSIASGPVIGTIGLLTAVYFRALAAQRSMPADVPRVADNDDD